ncbi:MAG: diacylglycerol kinase family protein [Bdellovibrionaceae bacterium]|nr:diacylglycerol kinase family protein [Pseudobdellovibrionaceae bacterium]
MLSFKKLIQSFSDAYCGLKVSLKEEQNLRIELGLAFLAILLGIYFHLLALEWIVLWLTIALIIGSELINTALEKTVDLASPEIHPLAKKAKDAAAAAVFIFSIMAVLVGLFLFLPKILGHDLF